MAYFVTTHSPPNARLSSPWRDRTCHVAHICSLDQHRGLCIFWWEEGVGVPKLNQFYFKFSCTAFRTGSLPNFKMTSLKRSIFLSNSSHVRFIFVTGFFHQYSIERDLGHSVGLWRTSIIVRTASLVPTTHAEQHALKFVWLRLWPLDICGRRGNTSCLKSLILFLLVVERHVKQDASRQLCLKRYRILPASQLDGWLAYLASNSDSFRLHQLSNAPVAAHLFVADHTEAVKELNGQQCVTPVSHLTLARSEPRSFIGASRM